MAACIGCSAAYTYCAHSTAPRNVHAARLTPWFQYGWLGFTAGSIEHEATTSKISEDQLFYLRQRGIGEEAAVALVVNGFCRDVLQQLPMEFAVEAQKLVGISLEGSVG